MNKTALREAILQKLREELALQTDAAALARDEATNEESRARSKYDTHSQEAAYLAEGQARLAAEAQASLQVYAGVSFADFPPDAAIAPGALIELQSGPRRSWYLLGPRAGGLELSIDGRDILVLTPQSPLGRALLGRHAGEVVQTPGRDSATIAHRILTVS